MKSKFLKGYWSGLLSCVLIFGIGFVLYTAVQNNSSNNNDETQIVEKEILSKIKVLDSYIDKFFLNDVDKDVYAEGIYKGIVESLDDPYSVYYTKEEYASMMESSSGVYYGIGATVSQDVNTGIITIVKPFVEGPAYEAGVLPGDIIYKVNGKEVTGLDLTEVVSRMKGEEGTTVEMTVMREDEVKPLPLTVTRRKIEVPTIESEMLENKIGYIAVSEFDEITAEQFRLALDELEKKGMEGLVIDLRNNGGGLLSTAVDMLDRMLPEGLILYTKDKEGKGEEYPSTAKEQFTKPLTVLINGNSASASEVFAGAIQDYGTGTLVGTKSFGKGIVQSVIPLFDGTAIKLTTSKYYTPKGRNIHDIGIEPDEIIELDKELLKKVVIPKDEDNQLKKAVEIINKKLK